MNLLLNYFFIYHINIINIFGFYARRKSNKIKLALALFKTKFTKVTSLFRKNFKSIWEFDPFMCPNCDVKLKIHEIFVSSPFGRPYHKIYS